MTTINTPNLPVPAGATKVYGWDDLQAGQHASRYFQGSSWVVECGDALNKDITVGLNGLQFANGHITRVINTALGEHDALDPLTPAQARELARALFEAAGVIDTLAENEVDSLAD